MPAGAKKAKWRIVILTYPCETCGAPPGQPCITLDGEMAVRKTEMHVARSRAASANHWQAADVPPPGDNGKGHVR